MTGTRPSDAGCLNILLDRDGTVIYDRHYLSDPAGVELLPGVGDALAVLARRGARFFLVSNQSGIGRGMFTAHEVRACNARLEELLAAHGVALSGSVFCPHGPEEACSCRKPGIGLWRELQRLFGIAPERAVMVGDKTADMAFAANAGLAARILVLTGQGRDTAAKLRLPLPGAGNGAVWLFPRAARPEHPQAVIGDFTALPEVLVALGVLPAPGAGAMADGGAGSGAPVSSGSSSAPLVPSGGCCL